MAAGRYKGVCSIANPRQVRDVVTGGVDGTEITYFTE